MSSIGRRSVKCKTCGAWIEWRENHWLDSADGGTCRLLHGHNAARGYSMLTLHTPDLPDFTDSDEVLAWLAQ